MMGFTHRILFTMAVAWLVTACSVSSDDTQGVTAAFTFDPEPHVGKVQCTVRLTHPDGSPVRCPEIELEGTMNHAGMVPVFATAMGRGDGTFVAPLEFTMGGDWIIFARGKTALGRVFETVSDVPGVRPRTRGASPTAASDE